MPCYITYSSMPNQSFAGLLHCATRLFPLNKRNSFTGMFAKKKDWKRLLVLHLFSRFAKKRLEAAAGIAPFFQIYCSL